VAKQRRGKDTRIKLIAGEITFSMSDPQNIELTRAVDHYGKAMRDFSPVFEAFSRYHKRSIMRNFAAEGRPRKWEPLQEATIRDRIRQGFGEGPILVRTGKMKKSFRFETDKPRSYRVFNLRDYFYYHQYGSPKTNLPARPMLVLLRQDQIQFTRLARRHALGERI